MLLQMGFTLTKYVTTFAVSSYLTFSPLRRFEHVPDSRLFSVALSLRFPSLDVIQHYCSVEPGLSSYKTLRLLYATVQFTLSFILLVFYNFVNFTSYIDSITSFPSNIHYFIFKHSIKFLYFI